LNIADIRDFDMPLPPRAEQRRIVAKLDALTARLARARAELDRVPVLAQRLRINVLRDVFGRSGGDLPQGWDLKRIDEIGDVQLGRQRSPKDHNGPNMRLYVRSANITWKGWDLSDVKEMNFSPSEFETFQLRAGDVLLNEGSGSAKEVGKPAIWNGELDGVCFQNTLLRVRPHAYSAELLRYAFLYLALSGQFIANTKGVNIIHIGKAGLAKTTLPVPPQDAQQDILEKFDAAFARADRLEAEAARARALIDRLESAILARAFRGELVPQDPEDEPASVLLDRIRAERAAAPKPKRGRRAASVNIA
jgi:type I restriction enzyme S subunit